MSTSAPPLPPAVAGVSTEARDHADRAARLCRLGRPDEAIALVDARLAQGRPVWALSIKTGILMAERRPDEALALHEELVARAPEVSVLRMNHGRALAAVGRLGEAVDALRAALALDPASSLAWCDLASLRTVRLDEQDVAALERALPVARSDADRLRLHFALGKAMGDLGRHEASFRHYETASRLRRRLRPHDPDAARTLVGRIEAIVSPAFLARRIGQGCAARDPIFVIGMPRSGSTLVEQILASHPLVEGLGELFELPAIVERMADGAPWPEAAARLGADELRALGEDYLRAVRRHRRTDRPFFTDKMPHNWHYAALIPLILPNATIIDVRRDPIPCCVSAFTTYFNLETDFPTDLESLGHLYGAYVRCLDHVEALLPGRIYRLRYERLVTDFEPELRRLLEHVHLPFDGACMRFHETPRPVHTPSAGQVRQPINRAGLDAWRAYQRWLAPLEMALGLTVGTTKNIAAPRG